MANALRPRQLNIAETVHLTGTFRDVEDQAVTPGGVRMALTSVPVAPAQASADWKVPQLVIGTGADGTVRVGLLAGAGGQVAPGAVGDWWLWVMYVSSPVAPIIGPYKIRVVG